MRDAWRFALREWARPRCYTSRDTGTGDVILIASMPSAVTAVIFAADTGLDENPGHLDRRTPFVAVRRAAALAAEAGEPAADLIDR